MAKASKQSETVETIRSVTLELTLEEARTLAVVYCKIGGSGPRWNCSAVLDALSDVGVTYKGAPEYGLIEDDGQYKGLYFSDYPAEG